MKKGENDNAARIKNRIENFRPCQDWNNMSIRSKNCHVCTLFPKKHEVKNKARKS